MTSRIWRACSFALLLLFVQQLALTHALEHVAADMLHLDADGDAAGCPECLALGGLQPGGATAGSAWSVSGPASTPYALALATAPLRRVATAHAIRAPPDNRD